MFRVPALLPEAGDTVSHAALLLAVHASVPPPVFETPTVFAAGFDPPAVPENQSDAEDNVSAGGAATLNVTLIVLGEPVAPGAVTVTTPE
jgi:hypothetical protein